MICFKLATYIRTQIIFSLRRPYKFGTINLDIFSLRNPCKFRTLNLGIFSLRKPCKFGTLNLDNNPSKFLQI